MYRKVRIRLQHTGWAKLNDTIAVHYVVVNDGFDNVDKFFRVKRQLTYTCLETSKLNTVVVLK